MAGSEVEQEGPRAPRRVVESGRTLAEAGSAQESLLRAGLPAVYVADLEAGALSYGVSVPPTAPYLVRAREAGVVAERRRSGGTGLLAGGGDVVWALVVPRIHPMAGRDYVNAYPRLGRGVVSVFAEHGLAARWEKAPGVSEAYCPLSSKGQVLVHGGRILAAAAQHLTAGALLHQGWVARRVDRELVARLFGLPEPGPADRLVGWGELLPGLSSKDLARELARHLEESFRPASQG